MGTYHGKVHKSAYRKAEKRKRYYARHPDKQHRAKERRGFEK